MTVLLYITHYSVVLNKHLSPVALITISEISSLENKNVTV